MRPWVLLRQAGIAFEEKPLRFDSFALPLPAHIAAYVQRVQALPGVRAWIEGALAEQDFRPFEGPYRLSR